MRVFFLVALFFCVQKLFAADSLSTEQLTQIKLLEQKVQNLEEKLSDQKQLNLERQETYQNYVDKRLDDKVGEINVRMGIYVGIFFALITIIVFVANWLGKRAIKNYVDELANKEIDKHLQAKMSNKIIDLKLTELGKPVVENLLRKYEPVLQTLSDDIENKRVEYYNLLNELKQEKQEAVSEDQSNSKSKKLEDFTDILKNVKPEVDYSSTDWQLKGRAELQNKNYNVAISFFDRSIMKSPKNEMAYIFRAAAKSELEQVEDAIADLTIAIELNPNNAVAYNNRGYNKNKLGEYSSAVEDLTTAINLNPKDEGFYANRATSYKELGRFEESINDLTSVIKLNPRSSSAYSNIGYCKNMLGKFEEAIIDFNKSIKLKNSLANPYRHLAYAKMNLGKFEEALIDVERAINLKPNYESALELRNEIIRKLQLNS